MSSVINQGALAVAEGVVKGVLGDAGFPPWALDFAWGTLVNLGTAVEALASGAPASTVEEQAVLGTADAAADAAEKAKFPNG